MQKHLSLLRTICALVVMGGLWPSPAVAAPPAAEPFDETRCTTIFAFDQASIPLSQNLRLAMRNPTRFASNPVIARGEPGSPDSWAVQFYGSVIREGTKFRLWYVAAGDERVAQSGPRSSCWRPAYAESEDGIHWTKPDLGLVEYHGNRHNNLIQTDPASLGILNLKVLYEPDEPNPEHRYKISTHVWFPKHGNRFGTLAPFFSADGLRWKSAVPSSPVEAEMRVADLVLPPLHFEAAGGLYKWDGVYYASGQNAIMAANPYHGRVARAVCSGDFMNWSHTSAPQFVRSSQHTLLGPGRSREGEQTHEAISVWNRGNVLLGLYGKWHGGKEWSDVTVDLGLVVSNDGVSFHEPAHEWTFLERGADGAWDQGGLLQGQGFENVGRQTYIYYGAWDPRNWQDAPPRGGVGLATLPRDRFGDLVVDLTTKGKGDYQQPEIVSEFVTSAIKLPGDGPHRFYVNADGLGPDASLRIELLGANTIPIPAYSGEHAAVIRESGFQTPIEWDGQKQIDGLPERARLKVAFVGRKNKDIRFSAIYVR